MHVRVLLPEELCNWLPSFSALVIRKETPSPLQVSCPMDGLPELPREHCLVKAPGHGIVLLLGAEGGPALLGSPFRLGIPHRDSILSLLPEVHAPGEPGLYLLGLADAQRLCEDGVGKDEGSLGVLSP